MFRWLKSLFRKVGILLLLLVAAYAGWQWGPEVFPKVHDWLGVSQGDVEEELVASPELADSVMARVQEFRRGDGPGQLALGDGITNPQVTLRDGRVHFRARVALSSFPDLPDLGPIIGLLPDTLDVALQAAMMPFGDGTAALLIHRLEAARIPLPRRLVPEILSAMGRRDQLGLPPEALMVQLPPGLGSAYILTDSLILSRDP